MRRGSSTVNFAPVANPNHEDFQSAIFDADDYPVVADTVLPKLAMPRPFERFADSARVFQRRDTLMEKRQNPPRYLWIQPVKVFLS